MVRNSSQSAATDSKGDGVTLPARFGALLRHFGENHPEPHVPTPPGALISDSSRGPVGCPRWPVRGASDFGDGGPHRGFVGDRPAARKRGDEGSATDTTDPDHC